MEILLFNGMSIAPFTQLILSLVITCYLLTVKRKSIATWLLTFFYLGMVCFFISLFISTTVYAPWRMYFLLPVQYLIFLFGMVAYIQFAYYFPALHYRREAHIVLTASIIIAVVSAGLVIQEFLSTENINEFGFQWLGFLLAIELFWTLIVFMRKTILLSEYPDCFSGLNKNASSKLSLDWIHYLASCLYLKLKIVCKPEGKKGKAVRAFLIITFTGLLLALSNLLAGAGIMPAVINSYIIFIGFQLFLFASVINYFNNATEPSTMMVKVVGIPLVTMLVFIGITSFLGIPYYQENYDGERQLEVELCRNAILNNNLSEVPSQVVYIVYRPSSESPFGTTFTQAYSGDEDFQLVHLVHDVSELKEEYSLHLERLKRHGPFERLKRHGPSLSNVEEHAFHLLSLSRPRAPGLYRIGRDGGIGFDGIYLNYEFEIDNNLYEAGFRYKDFRLYMHQRFTDLIYFILFGTVLIILLFPFLFRKTLIKPLSTLLEGVKKVNKGNLDISVPVYTEDEIGFLSRSFNGMVESLKRGKEKLDDYARELEQSNLKLEEYSHSLEEKVDERTLELKKKNSTLEDAMFQLKEAQNQLILNEKMASLGNLVAGVAHEVNTPIGAVNSAADVSARALNRITDFIASADTVDEIKSEPLFQNALKILNDNNNVTITAGKRITNIVQSLKNFARLDEAEIQTANLHEGLESTLTLLHHEVKNRIKIIKEYGTIPEIECYPNQLNQVFMNLLVNATHAIEGEGTITITTFVENHKIIIKIKDSGKGIPPDELARIFDPGFTTKGVGVGTGLGLSISYNILQKHKGTILVESEKGKGSDFKIIIPIIQSGAGV